MEGLVKAKSLEPGDIVQLNDVTDEVNARYNDIDGCWIDWESGDCGYVNLNGKYWVINL
jgi:hypothetical protein